MTEHERQEFIRLMGYQPKPEPNKFLDEIFGKDFRSESLKEAFKQ